MFGFVATVSMYVYVYSSTTCVLINSVFKEAISFVEAFQLQNEVNPGLYTSSISGLKLLLDFHHVITSGELGNKLCFDDMKTQIPSQNKLTCMLESFSPL